MTRRALDLLDSMRNDRYEAALEALREDTREWWADMLVRHPAKQGNEPATADEVGLRRFLEGEVLPRYGARRMDLANRPLIREQAFGEALEPDKLERLGRYEVHLDRKLERTLTMLLRLRTCGKGRSRTDPFGKTRRQEAVVPRCATLTVGRRVIGRLRKAVLISVAVHGGACRILRERRL